MALKSIAPALPGTKRPSLDEATWKHSLFQTWLNDRITDPDESIQGSVRVIRCACPCADADRFINDVADSVMNAGTLPWTEDEKKRFNEELQDPKWGLDWPVT